jgi:hypothetical protein
LGWRSRRLLPPITLSNVITQQISVAGPYQSVRWQQEHPPSSYKNLHDVPAESRKILEICVRPKLRLSQALILNLGALLKLSLVTNISYIILENPATTCVV